MKTLKLLLESQTFDTSSLRVLCESEGRFAYALEVTPSEARHFWERARALVPRTQYWPVLLTAYGDFPLPDATEEYGESLEQSLALAATIEFEVWVEELHRRWIRELQQEVDEYPAHSDDARMLLAQRGEFRGLRREDWPGDDPDPIDSIYQRILNFAGHSDHRLVLALLPVAECWQALAYLRWDSQDMPLGPPLHAAAHLSWHQRFGAELVALGSNKMFFRVARPPTTRRDALRLAKEHFHYSPATVLTRLDSIDQLASWLIRGEMWYMIWDE